MFDTETLIRATVAVIAICNPIGMAPVFLSMVAGATRQEKVRAATSASLATLVILTGAALIGRFILELFGISMGAFRVAGGLVIVLMGLEMLGGHSARAQDEKSTQTDTADDLLVPFVMPMVAGPGAITTVITLSVAYNWPAGAPVVAIVASLITAVVLWLTLWLAIANEKLITPRGQRILTRFMGLILVAIGAQLLMGGAREFFFPPG